RGRAQPCQGWGRGFESLRPLQFIVLRHLLKVQNHLICVLIPLKIYKAYSYRCAFAVEIGSIVRLCFGRKIYNAIVVSIDDKSSYKGKFKQVEYVYDIKFKHNFIDFMQFFADYSLTPLGLVATIMLRYFNED